jgi:hypothetical protein
MKERNFFNFISLIFNLTSWSIFKLSFLKLSKWSLFYNFFHIKWKIFYKNVYILWNTNSVINCVSIIRYAILTTFFTSTFFMTRTCENYLILYFYMWRVHWILFTRFSAHINYNHRHNGQLSLKYLINCKSTIKVGV